MSMHVCVVGVWLCLNCMGHHVWKMVTAESVFTRVTDGRRLALYSAYVLSVLSVVTGVAVAVKFVLVDRQKGEEDSEEGGGANVKEGATLSECGLRLLASCSAT